MTPLEQPLETASSWDSYKQVLNLILVKMSPRHCFEWGAGKSTLQIANHSSVETIDSVEHSPDWVDRVKPLSKKVNLIYEPHGLYPFVLGRHDKYDLFFIDGKNREQCLQTAREHLSGAGVVVLHDAQRPEYREAIERYQFTFFRDGGHTCVLTDSLQTATELGKFL